MVAAVWTLKNKKGAVAYTTAPLLMVEVYAEKKILSTPFWKKCKGSFGEGKGCNTAAFINIARSE